MDQYEDGRITSISQEEMETLVKEYLPDHYAQRDIPDTKAS